MPSYTSSTRLARVQYDPALDGSVVATSFFETTLTNDNDPDDVIVNPVWTSVTHAIPGLLAEAVQEHATDALDTKRTAMAAEKVAAKAAALEAAEAPIE